MSKFFYIFCLIGFFTFGFAYSSQAAAASAYAPVSSQEVENQQEAPKGWSKLLVEVKQKATKLKEIFSPLKPMRRTQYLTVGLTLLVVGLVLELLDGLGGIIRGVNIAFLGYIGPIFLAAGLIFCVMWFLF